MKDTFHILVVDDQAPNRTLLADLLSATGYFVETASGGKEALAKIRLAKPDLVLLDIVMPEMNGYEVCQAVRADATLGLLPVVLVTALDANEERIRGLESGADDFLTKPINQPELLARVKSLLRIKSLYDTVQTQAAELTALNAGLEGRVQEQIGQLQRLRQVKRCFSPPFADTSEPEQVMGLLRGFHREMLNLIQAHGGTLEEFTGSALMVIFNDPVIVENPARRAVLMALEMQRRFDILLAGWKKQGYDIALGIGISHGFATIGAIGDESRASYGVIGRVTNIAARLSAEAAPGQVLISAPVRVLVEDAVDSQEVERVNTKGFARPMSVYKVTRL